jgi:hypothetical protein
MFFFVLFARNGFEEKVHAKLAKIFILSQQKHLYGNTKDEKRYTNRTQMTQIIRIYKDFLCELCVCFSLCSLREMDLKKRFTQSPLRFYAKLAKIFILSQQKHLYENTKNEKQYTNRTQMIRILFLFKSDLEKSENFQKSLLHLNIYGID